MLPKRLLWVGSALEDLRAFPPAARRRAGYALNLLQNGFVPVDYRPLPTVGAGVCELRIRASGSYRILYVTKFEEGIYVLHAFEKRSRRTSRLDLEIGARRYRAVIESRTRP